MYYSIISAGVAVLWSIWYARSLGLSFNEFSRFVGKSANLGLCYGAFARPARSGGAAARAGLAAFCCAAYDVVTDWRCFAPEERTRFFGILEERVPSWAVDITKELYTQELLGTVELDGLERGAVAVEFVTGVIGSKSFYEVWGLHRLGVLCQIVDDILDEESDRVRGEQNCLQSPRGRAYLTQFMESFQELKNLFHGSPVMLAVLDRARARAGSGLGLDRAGGLVT